MTHRLTSYPIEQLTFNPFHLIGSEWMAVTTEKNGRTNAMTASWGGVGVIWGKNTATIYVRDSRFTKEYLDTTDTFSLAFFDESYKKDLGYLGKVSGRDEDKLAKLGYHIGHAGTTPFIEEAKLVLICRKLSATKITADQFIDPQIEEKWYPDHDMHTMYIAEITDVLH